MIENEKSTCGISYTGISLMGKIMLLTVLIGCLSGSCILIPFLYVIHFFYKNSEAEIR